MLLSCEITQHGLEFRFSKGDRIDRDPSLFWLKESIGKKRTLLVADGAPVASYHCVRGKAQSCP